MSSGVIMSVPSLEPVEPVLSGIDNKIKIVLFRPIAL